MTCNRKQGASAAQSQTSRTAAPSHFREKLVDLVVNLVAASLWAIPLHQYLVSIMEAALTEDEVSILHPPSSYLCARKSKEEGRAGFAPLAQTATNVGPTYKLLGPMHPYLGHHPTNPSHNSMHIDHRIISQKTLSCFAKQLPNRDLPSKHITTFVLRPFFDSNGIDLTRIE